MFNDDAVWRTILLEAEREATARPAMRAYYRKTVLRHESLCQALATLLASELVTMDSSLPDFSAEFERTIASAAISEQAAADIHKIASANPACPNALSAFLAFRGILAVQLHRIAHAYWGNGERTFAVLLQNWGARIYNVDIHPAARIGKGLFVDHAMGIVIGETAVIEDDVSIWHGVTLGSTFSESGDRHPKVRRGATLAAHALILGNIEIGENAVIAAGSVVRQSIPANMVAAGVPAKVIKPVAATYAAIAAPSDN
ncbi:serine acetyltransferase [Burkholderia sp. Bp8963]|uniref:serine O-acetyltransferase EpsC n=1 Tax=Burkholderia sp. Bp8963 TaxID=2184547 RepID=UPI000F5A17BA|nr:serine O-acetyltransferase EpsC [Burkholderia sp. Bp8963]RQS66517.1 serine acetyltransferase [Burkholderia sp. Bp8963]